MPRLFAMMAPRRSVARSAVAAVLLSAIGCGAIIRTVGGLGRWGWNPSTAVVHAETSFVSGRTRIAVERFAPARTSRFHIGALQHHPAVLVLHSSAGLLGRSGANVRRWADAFAEKGYIAYVVHYFDRTGDARTDDAREDAIYPQWVETLRDAVSFARGDRDVDSLRVDAFGVSLGGFVALALGAEDRRVQRLVVLSGGFFPTLERDRIGHLPPTLLLHGDADEVVPIAEARQVDSTLSRLRVPHGLVTYPGAGHSLDEVDAPDAIHRTLLFLGASHAVDGVRRAVQGSSAPSQAPTDRSRR